MPSLIQAANLKTLISGVIDYNFLCFRDAITQVFELRNKCQNAAVSTQARSGTPEGLANGAADSTETTSDHQLP